MTPELALEIVEALDKGERRIASPEGDAWVVDVEAKEAILEYFRLRKVEPMTVGGHARGEPGLEMVHFGRHRALRL